MPYFDFLRLCVHDGALEFMQRVFAEVRREDRDEAVHFAVDGVHVPGNVAADHADGAAEIAERDARDFLG